MPALSEAGAQRAIVVGEVEAGLLSEFTAFDEWLAKSNPADEDVSVSMRDPLCIIYSGGTTGLPKGIVMPQFAPVAAALRFNTMASFAEHDMYFLRTGDFSFVYPAHRASVLPHVWAHFWFLEIVERVAVSRHD